MLDEQLADLGVSGGGRLHQRGAVALHPAVLHVGAHGEKNLKSRIEFEIIASFFFWGIPGARLSRTPSLSGTLDASLRPGGGVWGCLGSKLWWCGTGIRTPDLLLESQECNHYAMRAAPLLRAYVRKNVQKRKHTCSSFNLHGSGYNLTPDFPHLWDLKCQLLQD